MGLSRSFYLVLLPTWSGSWGRVASTVVAGLILAAIVGLIRWLWVRLRPSPQTAAVASPTAVPIAPPPQQAVRPRPTRDGVITATFVATHETRDDVVFLTLSADVGASPIPTSCHVFDPLGRRWQAKIRTGFLTTIATAAKAWTVAFPRDFTGPGSAEPGTYRVEWKASDLFGFLHPEVLARDTFTYAPAALVARTNTLIS